MKVLHVISRLSKNGGGTAEIVPRICEKQVQAGFEVAIAYRDVGPLSDTAVAAGAAGVKLIAFDGLASPLNKISFSWGMFRRLGKLVAEADVVHVHCGWRFAVWWAAHCARKHGRPYVMMPHGCLEPERLKISRWQKRISGWLFDRRAYRDAAVVWVTSESEVAGVRAYGATCPVRVVPLGLEVRPYLESRRDDGLLKRLGIAPDRKALLYFSRITKLKGLDLLADVWKGLASEFPDWQLVLAGPDNHHGYRREIEARFVADCPRGSFVFTGPVYGADKFRLLKSASAFVLPTRNENFSIAVAEALASGVPVVCTKGAPWSVIDGRCGRWVDVSEDGLRRGLREVMSASEEERRAMGRAGQALVRERYDWSAVVKTLADGYSDIVL